jgi:hypothetical protein
MHISVNPFLHSISDTVHIAFGSQPTRLCPTSDFALMAPTKSFLGGENQKGVPTDRAELKLRGLNGQLCERPDRLERR